MQNTQYFSSRKSMITVFTLLVLSLLFLMVVLTARQSGNSQIINSNAQVNTTPTPEPSFVFGAVGDHGYNSSTTSRHSLVMQQIGQQFYPEAQAGRPHFFMSLGDLSYGDVTPETAWCQWVKDNINRGAGRPIGDTFGNTFPFQITVGGHENGVDNTADGLIDNFAAANCLPNRLNIVESPNLGTNPSAIGNYAKEFYFDFPQTGTPIARFISVAPQLNMLHGYDTTGRCSRCLDFDTLTTNRINWLRSTIQSARAAGIQWVVVSNHENHISVGIKSNEIGSQMFNVAVQEGADMILQGHEHNYQRSKQLRTGTGCTTIPLNTVNTNCLAQNGGGPNYTKGNGTLLLINGSGGVGHYTTNSGDSEAGYFATWMPSTQQTYGISKFIVTASQITSQYLNASGTYTDSFSITASGAPTPTVPTPSIQPTLFPTITPTPTLFQITPTPSPRPQSEWLKASDIVNNRNDNVVNAQDFSRLRAQFGQVCTTAVECSDINCDGVVNGQDQTILRNNFGMDVSTLPPVPACAYFASGIQRRGVSSASNGAGSTTLSITKPAGVTTNDVLVAQVVIRGSVNTIAPPSGWVSIRRDNTSSSTGAEVFYKVAGSAEPANYSFTISASAQASGGIVAYSGVSTTSPINAQGGQYNSATTNATAPSITTTVANTRLVYFTGIAVTTSSVTAPSGMSAQWTTASTNFTTAFMADQQFTTTGATGTRVGTYTVSASNLSQVVALRPQ